ncbi:hypothetical protein A2U01_0082664, partial [Trifolium medium]|nr:hypothetical protein [Trifolium medium]
MKDAAKVYVQAKDGRIGHDTTKEVINVESDKIENPEPDKESDFEEVISKNTVADKNLAASS